MLYTVSPGGIGAAEEKAMVDISLDRADQSICDAVWDMGRITMFQTFVAAGGAVQI